MQDFDETKYEIDQVVWKRMKLPPPHKVWLMNAKELEQYIGEIWEASSALTMVLALRFQNPDGCEDCQLPCNCKTKLRTNDDPPF